MVWFGLLIGLALAQGPAECEFESELGAEMMSVAWLSPMTRRVGAQAWLEVVPTKSLREHARSQGQRSVGATLLYAGARKKATEPKRPWKVTIFEIRGNELCGTETQAGLPVYRIRWKDLARRGFCLLPAERFVQEG